MYLNETQNCEAGDAVEKLQIDFLKLKRNKQNDKKGGVQQ